MRWSPSPDALDDGGSGAPGGGNRASPEGSVFLSAVPPGSNGNSAGGVGGPVGPVISYPDNFADPLELYENLAFAQNNLKAAPCDPPANLEGHAPLSDQACNRCKPAVLEPKQVTDSVTRNTAAGGTVTIRRDGWGVPYIDGDTRADAMYGFGYASAQDRPWLHDVLRAIGRGRFSEFLGAAPDTLGFDADLANFAGYSEKEPESMVERARAKFALGDLVVQGLDNMVAGINAYPDTRNGAGANEIPPEYASLALQASCFAPQLVWEVAIKSGGDNPGPLDFNGRGVVFGDLPCINIGRGARHAWSATSGNSDLVDVRVSKLCNTDGTPATRESDEAGMLVADGYLVGGGDGQGMQCRALFKRVDEWTAPQRVLRSVARTHYGPIFATATVRGEAVALSLQRATFLGELGTAPSFALPSSNLVEDFDSFRKLFNSVTGSFNWLYVDEQDAGVFHSGLYRERGPAQHPELPVRGDSRFEWQGQLDSASVPFHAGFFEAYGGEASEDACRQAVLNALDAARADLGGVAAMASWDGSECDSYAKGVDCGTVEACDAVEHVPLTFLPVPAIHWTNRPTFQQLIQIREAR